MRLGISDIQNKVLAVVIAKPHYLNTRRKTSQVLQVDSKSVLVQFVNSQLQEGHEGELVSFSVLSGPLRLCAFCAKYESLFLSSCETNCTIHLYFLILKRSLQATIPYMV